MKHAQSNELEVTRNVLKNPTLDFLYDLAYLLVYPGHQWPGRQAGRTSKLTGRQLGQDNNRLIAGGELIQFPVIPVVSIYSRQTPILSVFFVSFLFFYFPFFSLRSLSEQMRRDLVL